MQERWQMNKLGFVNFWLYDWEEFSFSDGRLLLRGENGAGKSVTTQSFIPFMLDGDLRPYRLDAFGSKDRNMKYYLLGDEKEESTGYLYLEFVKPQSQLYRTLVVGLRARRDKPVEFWGFCLSDGRRIGTGERDFPLFETKGSQHISLSRQEVRNRLGPNENWAERSSDYKEMVNRMLFGCAELEQYERLLRLLIQIRKPKLSKDFSPRLVREILNSSLQPLSEDDIAPMVNSMERMDNIQVQLDELQRSLQAARQLRKEYIRYNQFVLGKKAETYLTARHLVQKQQLEVQEKEDFILRTQRRLQQAQTDVKNFSQRESELTGQLNTLQADSRLESSVQRLEQLQEEKRQHQAQIEQEQAKERQKQATLSGKELQQRQARKEVQDHQDNLEQQFQQLNLLNVELRWTHHPSSLSAFDFNVQLPLLAQYAKRLRSAANLLQQHKSALDLLDGYERDLDAANLELQHARSQMEAAEQLVVRERDSLCAAFAQLETPALPFRLNRDEVQELFRLVNGYEGLCQEQAIQELLRTARETLARPLQGEFYRLKQLSSQQQAALNDLAAKRRELEQQEELPPPRSKAVQQTRDLLKERGIPHAAFYELVDFDDQLSPEQQALLETQLMETGLLDALVLPESAKEDVAVILAEHPDHFLNLENTPKATAPVALRPASEAPAWANVADLLSRISSLPEGTVYFSSDGRYRQGAIQGRSAALQPAGYIGASTRRENRRRQIAALSLQIEEQQQQIHATLDQIHRAETDLSLLQNGYEQRPTTADLAACLQLASTQRAEMDQKERIHEDRRQRFLHQQEQANALRAQLLPLTKDLPYERNAETYEAMAGCCDEYRSLFQDISADKRKLELTEGRLNDLEQQLDELNDELLECTDRIRFHEANLRKTQVSIDALEEYLNQPETRALAEKLESLRQELAQVHERLDGAKMELALSQNDLQHDLPDLSQRKERLQRDMLDEERKRQIFEEELCHGPGQPGRNDNELWKQAETAKNAIRQNDRNLGLDRLRTSLEKNVRDASVLNSYRITLNPLFENEDNLLRTRACIDLYPNGQRMDLLDFIQYTERHIEDDQQLLSMEDRRLFETILNQTITTKLSHRINNSQDWTRRMSGIMEQLNTSMGLRFSLNWKGKPADQQEELTTRELIDLLRKDPAVMGDADRDKITSHFRAKIAKARELSRQSTVPATYSELMRQALDFRNWFEFQLYYQKGNSVNPAPTKRELTDSAFNSFSGGEKAMAMYVPLFAALSAQYAAASEDAPQLMALDEAFAGVDETNIESMFALVHQLGLNYIMNSQALWGCYASVPSLNIAELWRPQDADVVTVVRYHWDGHTRRMEEL